MAVKKGRGSILFDFLLSVIIAVTLLLAVITYFNIMDKKGSVLKEVSNNSRYISTVLKELARKSIAAGDTKDFDSTIYYLFSKDKEKFYEIILYKVKDKKNLEIFYSTKRENIGKVIEVSNVEEMFKENEIQEGENYHEGIHTYDQINAIKYGGEVVGAISIVTSLKSIDIESAKMLAVNLMITIFSIIFIIGFTTFMLFNRIYNPINQLISEVRKIKEGEVAYELSLKVHNELGLLAEEINDMKTAIWEHNMDNRFSNPITGLPTLMNAVEKINDRLESDEFFGVISLSIRNYNEFILGYGFNKWEEILRVMSQIVHDTLEENEVIGEFIINHIKENQFIVIMNPESAEEIGKKIVEKFDTDMSYYYNEEDKAVSKIGLKDSMGNDLFYPMMTLFAGVITNKVRGEITSYKDVEDAIIKLEIDYQDLKEVSRCVVFEGGKGVEKEKDEIIQEVGEKVKENIEETPKEKEEVKVKKETKPAETKEALEEDDNNLEDLLADLKIE